MAFRFAGLLIFFSALSGAAAADEAPAPTLPLWEVGVGATTRIGPDYPAAGEYSAGVTAFPFLTYRGRILEIGGEQSFRIVPFRFDRVELGLTIDGSSAVDSRDNALRGALPDLDALVEFGPEVNIRLSEQSALLGTGTSRTELSLQTRGVFSVGSGIDSVGTLFRPALRYRQNGALKPGARVSASIGPVFATEGVHDFFYGAPGYEARGGYLGTELSASVRYPLNDRTRLIAGAGLTILSGAANDASPLFDDEVNASAFVGLTYSFYQSKRRTARDR